MGAGCCCSRIRPAGDEQLSSGLFPAHATLQYVGAPEGESRSDQEGA